MPFADITSEILPNSIAAGIVASADFNGDLLPDLYVTRSGNGNNDLHQSEADEIIAQLSVQRNQRGIQFNTDGEVTFDILNTNGPSSIPLDEVYIGAGGINPTNWEFTLSPENPEVEGIFPHTPGVDRGIYIGNCWHPSFFEVLAS